MALGDHAHPRRRSQPVALRVWALLVATLLPPLYLLVMVLTQTVDVPFADQWALLPLLAHSYQGTLGFGELWAQHNEHRLLFPRLIMLGLARLSGWSTRAEMLTNIALAAGILAVLAYQARSTAAAIQRPWLPLLPLLSLAIFCLNQAENWWAGWNIQIFLNVLAVSASLVLLSHPVRRWSALLLAVFCALVATYSYSSGLLVWPVGAAQLLLLALGGSRRDLFRFGLWCGAGALVIGAFFFDYTWNEQAAPVSTILANPRPYLTYTVTLLGAPPTRGAVEYLFGVLSGDLRAICNLGDSDLCSYVNNAAITAGLLGLALFVTAAWFLLRQRLLMPILPYLALGVYVLGTALLTSLGRAVYGNHQALAQRYATTATLFWIALALLLWLWAQLATRRLLRNLARGSISLLAILLLLSTLQGPDHFRWQYEFLAPARQELLQLRDDALLQRLFPDPQVVRDGAELLKDYRLSVFR